MFFKQFRLADMGCASYLVGSERSGEAVVVDPGWEIEEYLKEAQANKLRITGIFETHLHADHVSGNRRLAEATGAVIYVHEAANAAYPHTPVTDGTTLELGEVRLKVLSTPGHTWESITLLVEDTSDSANPPKLLSGDALFIGDVGRPDFAGQKGAGTLFDSLRSAIWPLSDETEVYPAHLAGSLCGRSMSSDTVSTLGREKLTNPALQIEDRDEFVTFLTADLPPEPPDFRRIVEINRAGPPAAQPALPALPAESLRERLEQVTVVDTREPDEFWQSHIPGSLNVPLGLGQFGANLAQFVPAGNRLALLANRESEVRQAQASLGVVGRYELEGFILTSEAKSLMSDAGYRRIEPEKVQELLDLDHTTILDVRQPEEFAQDGLPGAINIPVRQLPWRLAELEALKNSSLVVTCAAGYRSSLATSFLIRQGWTQVQNLNGGMEAYSKAIQPAPAA